MASIYDLDRLVHKGVRTKDGNDLGNVIAIAIIMVIGILLIPHVFAQPRSTDIMMAHMRFTHHCKFKLSQKMRNYKQIQ